MGAAVDAVEGRTFAADEIAEIVVSVPEAWVPIVLEPAAKKRVPGTSMREVLAPYAVASMLVRGHVGVVGLHRRGDRGPGRVGGRAQSPLRDPRVPTYPQAFPGGTRVTLTSGETFESDFAYQKGGPENPLSPADVQVKFRDNAGLALSDAALATLEEALLTLERAERSVRSAPPADAGGSRPRMSSGSVTTEQAEIVAAVREFVDKDVIPVASELEHADEFPAALVETMKEMGLFGTTIAEEYGGLGLGIDTYALIQMELSRGWVTLSGIMNGSFIAATMIGLHGTDEQRRYWLPRLASCEIRAALSMSEPHAGSDVQAIRTTAVRVGDEFVLNGQKMWVTNAWRAGLVAVLAKTDTSTDPPHLGMTGFLVEKQPEGGRCRA